MTAVSRPPGRRRGRPTGRPRRRPTSHRGCSGPAGASRPCVGVSPSDVLDDVRTAREPVAGAYRRTDVSHALPQTIVPEQLVDGAEQLAVGEAVGVQPYAV